MDALFLRAFRQRRRFAWLLWFALLLPLAQTAAAWHGLAHARSDAAGPSSDKNNKQALHQAPCDLCLAAAMLGSGVPAGTAPALPRPSARHRLPDTGSSSDAFLAPAQPYRSRAPPLVLH